MGSHDPRPVAGLGTLLRQWPHPRPSGSWRDQRERPPIRGGNDSGRAGVRCNVRVTSSTCRRRHRTSPNPERTHLKGGLSRGERHDQRLHLRTADPAPRRHLELRRRPDPGAGNRRDDGDLLRRRRGRLETPALSRRRPCGAGQVRRPGRHRHGPGDPLERARLREAGRDDRGAGALQHPQRHADPRGRHHGVRARSPRDAEPATAARHPAAHWPAPRSGERRGDGSGQRHDQRGALGTSF